MKTILVPTDFSENAENALYYAIDIANRINAKIILLNAYQSNNSNPYIPLDYVVEENKQVAINSDKQLKEESLKIKQVGGVDYECISIEDSPVEAMINIIKEKNIDLVVMGTKGESNFLNTVFGSNTANIIEKASCPVIAVPEEAIFNEIKKITYATSYNQSDIYVLEKIVDIAKLFNAQVNVLHISDTTNTQDEEKKAMKKFMDEVNQNILYNNMSFQLLEGEDVEDALEKYLDDNSTSMLVMSTHHRSFFDKIFGKSITKHMAYHTNVPLMAFHHTTESAVKLI